MRAILKNPARRLNHSGASMLVRKYSLSGLLFCGRCGTRLKVTSTGAPTPSSKVRVRAYCPPANPAMSEGGCGGIAIGYAPTADFVTRIALARMSAAGVEPLQEDSTSSLLAALAADDRRLAALGEAFADAPDADPVALRVASDTIRARQDATRRQLAAVQSHVRAVQSPISHDAFTALPAQRQHEVFEVLLERVIVGPAQRGRTTFDPDRLTISWR